MADLCYNRTEIINIVKQFCKAIFLQLKNKFKKFRIKWGNLFQMRGRRDGTQHLGDIKACVGSWGEQSGKAGSRGVGGGTRMHYGT